MTSPDSSVSPVLGTLHRVGDRGVVRLESRLDADPAQVWAAVTDPLRLARWLGEVEGELRLGGSFRAKFRASGWEGECTVEWCEAPSHLRVATSSPDQPDGVFDVTVSAVDGRTVVVVEDRGVPLDEIAAYGAGDQIHLEDLGAYLDGREPCDARARWQQLASSYEALAADLIDASSRS
ncbi:MAG: SRPBCC domain-containing protein [Actinomycetales bacterium]